VTEEIAREIKHVAFRKGQELSPGLRDFIDYQIELSDRSNAFDQIWTTSNVPTGNSFERHAR
jgi:hypothetical protein